MPSELKTELDVTIAHSKVNLHKLMITWDLDIENYSVQQEKRNEANTILFIQSKIFRREERAVRDGGRECAGSVGLM